MDLKIFMLIASMIDEMTAVKTVVPATKACYLGWGYWRGACYKMFQTRENWNRSQNVCMEKGGSLLEFTGREEEDYVLSLLTPAEDFWIGMHLEMDGKWRWRSGSDVKLPYFAALLGTSVSLKPPKCETLSTLFNGSLSTHDCRDHLPSICKTTPFDCNAHFDWHVSQSQHCLWFSDNADTGSWPRIRQKCQGFNSDLATFATSEDASLLPTKLRRNVSYWVGLRNETTTFDLIWLDRVKEANSSRFTVVKATNYSIADPQCGCVTLTLHEQLNWELDDCNTPKQFICESKVPKLTTTTSPPSTTASTSVSPGNDATKSSLVSITYRTTQNIRQAKTSTPLISDAGIKENTTKRSSVTTTKKWFIQHLPKRQSALAHLLFRRRAGHGHEHEHEHEHWQARATFSPADDCCFKNNFIICKHNSSYYSSLSSFRSCKDTLLVGGALLTAVAHAHTSKIAPLSLPYPPESSTSGSSALNKMIGRSTESTVTMSSVDTHTMEVTSHMTSGDPGSDVVDAGLAATLNNFSAIHTQLRKLCQGSDEPFSCRLNHIQDGGLEPEVITRMLHDFHRSLLTISKIQHPKFTKIIFENFFRIVNFFIEGSYSQLWHKYNLSLCEVISVVEPFLDNNIHNLDPGDGIVKTYSHVNILIKRMKREEMDTFRFDDHEGFGHIDYLATSSISFDDVAVAVVFMKVPVLQVTVENSNYTGFVVSPILSLSAYNQGRQLSLTNSFTLNQTRTGIKRFKLTDNETDTSPVTCAFWDNVTREWSTFGCWMTSTNNKTSQCYCNHTTNFAILMQVNYFQLSATDRFALEVITYIGCSVALITQVIAITVFTFVGSLNSERVIVHRNLCIAIVGAQVTFLAGIDAVDNRLVCAVVALVLHYCYTAVFIWMLVEGLHLYSKVVQVFGTERSRITYYMAFGWGVPVILVTISAAADWNGYGTDHSCWLSTTRRTIWAFVGPALAIVIVNLVILAMVVKIVMSSSRKQGEYDHIRAGIKGALFLLPLLGLTWVFGLAAVNEDLVVFQYLFAIFNSLQGFFIFLFHCAFNTEVRQALRRLKEKRSLQKGDLSVTSGSHGTTFPLSDAWAVVRSDRNYPQYQSNQVAPLATTATTTTRLNSLSHSKESDDNECPYNTRSKEENEELSLLYI